MKKDQVALLVTSVVIDAVRDRGKASGVYTLDLKNDPDRIIERTQEMLVERAKLPKDHKDHVPVTYVLLTNPLYTGKCVVVRDGEVDTEREKMVREQLCFIADRLGGTLHGRTVAQIGSMKPGDLEDFRKQACSQKNGAVQLENHVFYWLAAGNANWMHKSLKKLFPELQAMSKVTGTARKYEITFTKGAAVKAVREGQNRLKAAAAAATAEREQKEKAALEKKRKKEEEKRKKAEEKAAKEAAEKAEAEAAGDGGDAEPATAEASK